MSTEETIERLEAEIEKGQSDLREATRLAVANPTDRLEQARALIESREVLRLVRGELAQARQRLVEEQQEAQRALREANAKRIAELTRDIETEALAIERGLRRAGRSYKTMLEHVAAILALGNEAERFDLATFRTARPGKLPYEYVVNKCSEHFGFGPSHHLEHWPKPDRAAEGAARALANFTDIRERIVSPENFTEPKTDNNAAAEWIEASPEEIENAVH
jgi:predicted nucleic acid-binding protein